MRIEKEPSGSRNRDKSLYFTKSCRDAVKQILSMNSGERRILLPAYVGLSLEEGSGILDPVKESNSKFCFYEVNSQLDPDLNSLKSMITSFTPSHVLVVNYFGYLMSNRKAVFQLLSEYQVCVIEDFAHLIEPLRSHKEISMLAHYEVFSLHKTMGAGMGGGAVLCESSEESFDENISDSSLKLLGKSDMNYISDLRWQNYIYLESRLNTDHSEIFTPFFSDRRAPVLPLNFPIRFPNRETRHAMYTALIDAGIFPTSLYHRLVPEINIENYPLSIQISQTILNLPIHQDVDIDKINILLEVVRKFCDEK